jgi:hypothetical protein
MRYVLFLSQDIGLRKPSYYYITDYITTHLIFAYVYTIINICMGVHIEGTRTVA